MTSLLIPIADANPTWHVGETLCDGALRYTDRGFLVLAGGTYGLRVSTDVIDKPGNTGDDSQELTCRGKYTVKVGKYTKPPSVFVGDDGNEYSDVSDAETEGGRYIMIKEASVQTPLLTPRTVVCTVLHKFRRGDEITVEHEHWRDTYAPALVHGHICTVRSTIEIGPRTKRRHAAPKA